jgi:S1-C subfamily serine protease
MTMNIHAISNKRWLTIAFLLCCFLICICLPANAQVSLQQIFKKNAPAVVVIFTVDKYGKKLSFGSGFVVSAKGIVVTNHHVIKPKKGLYPDHLKIKMPNGDIYTDVWVIHSDERRDFAVLSIKAWGLATVRLGDSERLSVGDQVTAIGAPKGLEHTFSVGIVSNVRYDSKRGYHFIQHQTPISPGSSGGPLFNGQGEVIGINTFFFKGGQSLNGAIPIKYIKPYLQDRAKFTYKKYIASTTTIPKQLYKPVKPRKPLSPTPTGNYKWRFIDKNGKTVIKLQNYIYQAYSFKEGLAAVKISGGWGFLNKFGRLVFKLNVKYAGDFSEGLATVRIGKKWGYINKAGKTVIAVQYDSAAAFLPSGIAAVKVGSKWGYIDKQGTMRITPKLSNPLSKVSEGLATIRARGKGKSGSKWGFTDKRGKIMISPKFDMASSFSNGLAAVKSGNYWGYINKYGRHIIKPQFISAYPFSISGIAMVKGKRYGKPAYGYINRTGKYVIYPYYKAARSFASNGLAAVMSSKYWKYINTKGKIAINGLFYKAYSFSGGLALVQLK